MVTTWCGVWCLTLADIGAQGDVLLGGADGLLGRHLEIDSTGSLTVKAYGWTREDQTKREALAKAFGSCKIQVWAFLAGGQAFPTF